MESALREGGRAPGLKLIETMAWSGTGVALAELHKARLMAGIAALGWPMPKVDVTGPAHAARLRLTVDASGRSEIEVAPMPVTTAPWRVGLCGERLFSGDPWLRIKTTRRGAYDAARAALGDLDEVVFQNERGEVCDGSITTVFFDRGQGLRTPPLGSGLLPGVLRAAVRAREEVLLARDLPGVRLWVGNAVRGMIPAVFTQ